MPTHIDKMLIIIGDVNPNWRVTQVKQHVKRQNRGESSNIGDCPDRFINNASPKFSDSIWKILLNVSSRVRPELLQSPRKTGGSSQKQRPGIPQILSIPHDHLIIRPRTCQLLKDQPDYSNLIPVFRLKPLKLLKTQGCVIGNFQKKRP